MNFFHCCSRPTLTHYLSELRKQLVLCHSWLLPLGSLANVWALLNTMLLLACS